MSQNAATADEMLLRLRCLHSDYFPLHQQRFQDLVAGGPHPNTLFIGCSDSRVVHNLPTGIGPGKMFIARNVGAFIPAYDGDLPDPHETMGTRAGTRPAGAAASRQLVGLHGTTAAIEFAVLSPHAEQIIVCGHSHCGAIRAAHDGLPEEAVALQATLQLAREALLPVQTSREALRRPEPRVVVLQLERLMDPPMVRREVKRGQPTLQGWHCDIEDGEIHVFDVWQKNSVSAATASNSGTEPYQPYVEHDGQIISN